MVEQVPRAYHAAVRAAPRRVTGGQTVAAVEGEECVVFLIGMRVNRWRRVRQWLPVFTAMPRMVADLRAEPAAGLLGARSYWSGRVFLVVQYWRSVEDLGTYARDAGKRHRPAWAAFNRAAAGTGDVGIFHETYVVPAEGVETLYGNMPTFGLAQAHRAVRRGGRPHSRAQRRMGQRDPQLVDPELVDPVPVEPAVTDPSRPAATRR